jgi:alkylation response protein AidB-like acyl-CoA dehydrogenase
MIIHPFPDTVLQLGSFCLSEPASGSDAFALQTRATRDGDNWILNGSKMWITNSYEAEVFLVFANVRVLSSRARDLYVSENPLTD